MEAAGGAWCDGAVLRFRFPDPSRKLAGVRVLSSAFRADLTFRADLGAWELCRDRQALWRLDYHWELTGADGRLRSVGPAELRCPDYLPPGWLALPGAPGRWRRMTLPRLPARVWSPMTPTARVLVAHDGPDYHRRGELGRYAAAAVGAGWVSPFHLVLLGTQRQRAGDLRPKILPERRSGGPGPDPRSPDPREDWYSADPGYARLLADRVLPRIRACLGAGPVVGAGVSLGALAMLHAQRRHPAGFAGLFLQSGSYFTAQHDRHESGFRHWGRIARFTWRLRHAAGGPAVPVTLTCGTAEENLANNRDVVDGLRKQGYPVAFAENPDAHTWTGWRDALHPHLTDLLRRVWPD